MFRNLCIICVILGIIQVLAAIARIGQLPPIQPAIGGGLLSSCTTLIIEVYTFICIDSLFKKFGEESFPQNNPSVVMHQGPYVIGCQQQPQIPYPHVHVPVYAPVPTAPKY